MDERLPKLRDIFERALDLDPSERGAFVRDACGDDALRADIEALLAAAAVEGDSLDDLVRDVAKAGRLAADRAQPIEIPAVDPPTLVGGLFDGLFQVEALLGEGGMGTVYRARHTLIGDTVALKLLRPLGTGTAWFRRFVREGQAARRFRHPNAVAVFDLRVAREDGTPYLVMEYVDGHTLRSELRERFRLPSSETIDVLEPIASALDAAHAAGVVHRDLKPENVMIAGTAGGPRPVKLLDLGVAKLFDAPEAETEALTRPGGAVGTPAYMAPELWGEAQRDGKRDVDGRADVYALGVMAYELVSGTRPFAGATAAELMRHHLSTPPQPLGERVPGISRRFERAVARALAKDRGDRPAGAGAFVGELREALAALAAGDEAETPEPRVETSETALLTEADGANTEANPPTNLPEQLTSFVGRGREAAEVAALLGRERLVTIAGPGGIGKTRLALEVARRALDDFSDGVWFVDLALLAAPELVAKTVALTLGIQEQPNVSALDALCEDASGKRLLVVLDNCEHLAAACAGLVSKVLRGCPHVRVLATSREVLSVPGEAVWQAPALEQDEAERLFVARARLVRLDFAVTECNAEAVAELCRRLEGIPLAVELAAARVGVLTPAQMLARIEKRLDLLATKSEGVPSRHRTLRASIEWSYGLLDRDEQRTFAALSVFRGGWTLGAAEAVVSKDEGRRTKDESAGDSDIHPSSVIRHASQVVDLLDRLRAASLVSAEEQGEEMRYRLLETIREFASECLSGEEWGELMRRHADYFAELAEAAEPWLKKADTKWLERLDAERDNVRATLERCQKRETEAAVGLRVMAASWRWWGARGHLSEGRAAAEVALARRAAAPAALQARALLAGAYFCLHLSDHETAMLYAEQALGIWRALGDRANVTSSLHFLANIAFTASEYERADAFAEEGLGIARELGDPELIASALVDLGMIAQSRGDHAGSIDRFEEALALQRQAGVRQHVIITLGFLGESRLARGEYSQARAHFEEGFAAAREGGNTMFVALFTQNLGDLKRRMGEYDRAEELCADALERYRALGMTGAYSSTLQSLGAIARETGAYDRAGERLRECLAIITDGSLQKFACDVLEEFAALASVTNRAGLAARLLGAAAARREALGTPAWPSDLPTIDGATAAARAALGDEAFESAFAAGRALSVDEAFREALRSERTKDEG